MRHSHRRLVGLWIALFVLQCACSLTAPSPSPSADGTPGDAATASAEAALDKATAAFLADMQDYNVLRLRDLVEMLDQDPPPFLLDVRELSEVEASGHIPGAVVIPLRELADHLDRLPAFDQTVVSYCGGGWRCTLAMTALGMLGWQHVLSLQDGSFGGYRAAGYEVVPGLPPEAARRDGAQPDPALVLAVEQMLRGLPEGWGAMTADELADELAENPDLVLLDARAPSEVDQKGRIEAANALNIPVEQLVDRRFEWPSDRNTPIVVYSGSGHRGSLVMAILRTYGYVQARSLAGGLGAWVEAGYPVAEPATP